MNALPERRFRRFLLLIAAVGALHGLLYVPFAGPYLGDSYTYIRSAKAILRGGYTTPLPARDVTGLRLPAGAPERQSYRTPGYPALLAVFGGGLSTASRYAVVGAQAVLTAIAVALLGLTGRRLWSARGGLVAAAVYALDPYPKHYVPRILTEALASALVVAGVYAFVRAWQERSRWWWSATGAAVAALALTRPVFALAVPLVLLAAVLQRPRGIAVIACGAASAVLLAPWLVWTTVATGRPVLSDFGEGWNLLLAAHGEGLGRTTRDVESDPSYRRDFLSVHALAPTSAELRRDPDAHPRYLRLADEQQRRLARATYRERLRDEPLDVAGETAYRAYFLWMVHEDWVQPSALVPLLRLVDALALVLAAAGAVVAFRRGGALRCLAVFVLCFTVVSALHHVEARYAIPLRGLYLGSIAIAVASVAALRDRRRREQEGRDPDDAGREVPDRRQVRLRQREHEAGGRD